MFIKRAIISSVFSIALIFSVKAIENPELLKIPPTLALARANSPQQLLLQAIELVGPIKQSAFLPLATDLYRRPLPVCKTFSLSPCCSIESLMHAEILSYDPSARKIFVKNGGGMTADKIMLSDKYVARLSYKKDCFVEAVNLYNLVQKLNLTSSSADQIGFNFCLPLSILFVNQKLKSDKLASVVLMPKAKGKALYEYIAEGNSSKVLGRMFKELGRSLGKFQTFYMEKIGRSYFTAAHGDFHEGNIFCATKEAALKKENLWSFNLIDCGSTELKRMHLLMDPLYFLVRTTHYLEKCHFKEKHLVYLTYKFYKGYLKSLNQSVVEYLRLLLPSGRLIAQYEEERMNGILFMDPTSKEGQKFLTKFDSINKEAFEQALVKVLPKSDRRRLYAF